MIAVRILIVLLIALTITPYTHAETKATEQAGVIVFKVIPNQSGASTFFKNWQKITIKQVGPSKASKSYSLTYTDKGNTRTAIYSGLVPPGLYRFVDFSSLQCGWLCVSASIKVNDKFSQFSVEAGKLTYLGNIVQLTRGEGDVLLVPQLDPPKADAISFVTQIFPQYRSQLESGVLGWVDAAADNTDANLYQSTKQLSAGLFGPTQMQDGSLLFGSSLGVVRHWTPGKAPVALDTGASVSIESAIQLPDGTLLAGGELGVFKMSTDDGLTWADIDAGIPFGIIKSIKISDSGDIYVTHLLDNVVSIFKGRIGIPQWKLITEQTLSISKIWDIQGIVPETFQYQQYLLVSLPGRNLLVLDTHTDEFSVRKSAGGIQGITMTGDGVIRCRCVGGIAVNPWESHDLGATWQKSAVDRFMQLPAFKDQQIGVAMMGVWLSKDAYMAASQDGGKTWDKQMVTDGKYYPNIFYADRQKIFVAYDNYDSIIFSADDGKSWVPGY
ncbi:MAG: hypothetical protein QM808_09395 [Steroidobacteraceae bacterium]